MTAPGEATAAFDNNKAVYNITNVGNKDHCVQLKQNGITLEKGCTYKITFKATSTEARTIKCAMLTAGYDWYGGADLALEKDTEKSVEIEFTVTKDTDSNMTMVVSMGQIEGVSTPASTITLSDFVLVKVQADAPEVPTVPAGENMLSNGDFSQKDAGWENAVTAPGVATATFDDNKAVYNITNVGEDEWHVQLKQSGIT